MRIAGPIAWAALLVVGAPLAAAAPTEADFTASTTGDLVDLCDSATDTALGSAALGFCYGFAQGAVSVQMEHDLGSRGPKLFCLPSPPPGRADAIGEFVKWARAAPDRLNAPPTDSLLGFLADRFPCAAGK